MFGGVTGQIPKSPKGTKGLLHSLQELGTFRPRIDELGAVV